MSDVVLTYSDGELPLTEVAATVGESGFNIAPLLKQTGRVTLDHGFVNTASCTSAITYIDGDKGILRYRGYPIEQLAEQSTFLETAYLLIYGDLPSVDALEEFKHQIRVHTMLHEDLRRFFDGFPRDAHPMPVLSSAVSALSTFYQDSLDPFDPRQVEISTIRLLAKVPTIAAYAHKKAAGQPYLYPDNSLGFIDNFLRMTFGVPAEEYEVNPVMSRALNQLLLLHADHEQNCSTSTVRLVGLVAREPVRVGLRRDQCPLRPAARRRQPGGHGDAAEHPGPGRRRQHVHPPGQGPPGRRQADGLRPSRLQELRPTGRHRQDDGA